MLALRFASVIAALVTITLNASYGFKTSATLEYAILFAALNAALDVAKCSCLVGARLAWQSRQRTAALLLFVLFWPLLINSLWCGLSEVAFNRASEQGKFASDTQARTRAADDHKRIATEMATLETNPIYRSTSACALPKTNRERTLCARHAQAKVMLAQLATDLSSKPDEDPTPQITLLASWTGLDLPILLLATALWPIALAELCGSVGFYLSASSTSDRINARQKRFWPKSAPASEPVTKKSTQPVSSASSAKPQTAMRWPTIGAG